MVRSSLVLALCAVLPACSGTDADSGSGSAASADGDGDGSGLTAASDTDTASGGSASTGGSASEPTAGEGSASASATGGSSAGSGSDTDGGTGGGTGDTDGEDPWNSGDPSDPFAFASCSGAPLTEADALSVMTMGGTAADFGAYRVFMRSRQCNDQTGCTAWSVSSPHGVAGRVDPDALFNGIWRPELGMTRVHIEPQNADVVMTYGNGDGWCAQVVDGTLGSPCDITPLLVPLENGGTWTVDPGVLRRNCFMFRAHGVEPVSNSVNEREIDVVIRGDHAIDRGVVLTELTDAVASVPMSLPCWEHVNNGSNCSPHWDQHNPEMFGLEATFTPGIGDGIGSVVIVVPEFSLVSGTVELDDRGYGQFWAPSGNIGGFRQIDVSMAEGVLIVTSHFNQNFPNSCVAEHDWSCGGVYIPPT